MKVLGLGHSHIVAVANGCYALQHENHLCDGRPLTSRFLYLYDPTLTPTLVDGAQGPRLNDAILALIEGERPDGVVLCFGGNEHLALSVAPKAGRVDFIMGDEPALACDSDAAFVTEAAVRETLREKLSDSFAFLDAMRAATALPIAVIAPPAPLPNARIMERPGEFFSRGADARQLSAEAFRYKVWRLQLALLRDCCQRNGMTFIDPPDDSLEPPGVLARDLWGDDASHANAQYGRRMVLQALAYFAERHSLAPAR